MNYPETYKKIFDRLREELTIAKDSPNSIQHLIILLGIPIAYPVSLMLQFEYAPMLIFVAFDMAREYFFKPLNGPTQIYE